MTSVSPTRQRLRLTPTKEERNGIREDAFYFYDASNASPKRENNFKKKKATAKQQQPPQLVHFSTGHALALLTLGALLAVILSAVLSVRSLSTTITAHMDILTVPGLPRQLQLVPRVEALRSIVSPKEQHTSSSHPKIVWLMSFPNRYVAKSNRLDVVSLFFWSHSVIAFSLCKSQRNVVHHTHDSGGHQLHDSDQLWSRG